MTNTTEKKPELSPYEIFLMRNMVRVNMWIKDHPRGEKFPIVQDEFGNYQWINRSQRRKK